MKIKTFILTFLMMMSSPFLFGEQTTGANYAWGDAPYSQNSAMMIAKLNVDGVTDYSIYEIGAFCDDEIRGKQRATSTGDFYLNIMLNGSSEEISFRLYNHETDLEIRNVYETITVSNSAHIGEAGSPVTVHATCVAKIGNIAYPSLVEAVAAAEAGQTVELIADATGAGLKINKDVTIDFGGNTYTINEAVGSNGTQSQGFQLLKGNTVTLKNGNIAIAGNTNVKWMFNAYADVTLEGLNVNCANMAEPAEGEANYVLVVNNGGGATPTVNYSEVNVTNFPTTNQIWLDPTTTFKAEAGLENLIETEEGYVVVYNNGTYTAVAANVEVRDGEAVKGTYATMAEAVSAAQAGNTIVLLNDITENVTVSKNLTIDGAGKNYTGTMTISSGKTVTVQDVNFVKGCIDKSKGTSGTLTVKDCTFDGVDNSINYAVTMRGGSTVTVEGCSVVNYGYGMLYVPSAVSNVNVKSTTVEDVNYGVHVAYGNKVNIEDVTMTDVAYGIMTQNYGAKTITIKNSSISGTNSIYVWERNTTVVDTFKFEGANTLSNLTSSAQAKLVLVAADATLTAPEGFDVTTSVVANVVVYADGAYKSVPAVASITANESTTYYRTLVEAVAAAEAERTVELIADATGAGLKINKDVTIDFGGNTYTINQAVGSTGTESQGFQLLKGNTVTLKNGNIAIAENTNVKWMFNAYADVTLEGLNVNCANMAEPAEGEANYVLVVNNGGGATPTVNYSGVNVSEFPAAKQIWLDPATTFKAEAGLENLIETEEGYVVVYNNGTYTAVAANVEVRDGEAVKGTYATMAEAVLAAQAGNTIVLLNDITENVTVSKNLTIDGAGKNYTGNISAKGNANSTTVTVKNVNFVGGTGYAITTNTIKSITVENCTVANYGYGFLYANKSTPAVVVKNVTVDGGNYGFHWVYGTTATLENVTMTNVTYGLYIQNYASKTINVKDSNISSIAIWERSGYSGVQTFKFEGENTVGTLSASQYAKYVLTAADATLAAPEGFTVSVTEDLEKQGYVVEYNNGVYSVVAGNILNSTTSKKYATLQAAIDEAVDNDVIVVLKDIVLGYEDAQDATVKTFFNVNTGKIITIDLNGNNVKAVLEGEETVKAFFYISNNTNLTLKDSSDDNSGTVEIESEAYVSTILCNDGGRLTVEDGNYILEKGLADGSGSGGLVYSGQNEVVTINGGTFKLGNVGTSTNGSPWIFNASGQNTRHIIVNGGTFNADILHQNYPFEVQAPKEKALQYDADAAEGLWTMVDAVAYVNEQHKSGIYYTNEVGFVTLAEAFAAAATHNQDGAYVTTVTLLDDVQLDTYVTISESVNLNLDQFNITRVDGTALYVNGENIQVAIDGEGTVSGYQAVFVNNGTVTIDGGNFVGNPEAVYVINNGHAVINGGTFSAGGTEVNFVLNEYDATRDFTTIAVKGGKFNNFNPENNAAEGAGTNFCASGYAAVETAVGSNIWKVMPVHKHDFYTGWRWYSTYIDINGSEGLIRLENALEEKGLSINHNVDGFVNYEEGLWWNDLATLKETNVMKMYKIEVSGDLEMKLIGNIVDFNEAIEIKTGYNWIGYPFKESVNLNEAFAETFEPVEGDYMISQFQFAFYYNGTWNGSLMSLNPGEGYIYERVGADTELNYNVDNINGNVVRTNISTEDNKWIPNARMYPNNMTMIAVVDGAMGDNYEVAALVNGEVRGSARPIYVEALDAYMMFLTIHGDDVEEMSFMYYDLTTGESYMLNDRFDYTNDAHLGSVNEPYVFSRGTTGIGEAAMSNVNIYPNPTTTGTEINLQTVCDTVEVFNALGVKVAEYQNVDSIDALETAGIYVIRITNDGNVQNCRLVVK